MCVVLGAYWLRVQIQASNPTSAGPQFWDFDEDLSIASVAYAIVNVSILSGLSFSYFPIDSGYVTLTVCGGRYFAARY